ncbi:acid sphingomyelinase-like phosphodiesterase 3b [Elysia marginata]|uniref:Acid sphingomyelinase-like phosphodiesterase 3b n=1 Tax=Elysia marginata TaxID=1093978 RepID=A0AAV4HSZ2_9GAST|nr:acid sphingomyelinase-like phosphodiesterase 3b [Elysia marginata]
MWEFGAVLFSFIYFLIHVAIESSQIQTDLDKGYFWHVTDLHYDDSYGKSGQSCGFPVSNPGPFGNGSCDSPLRLIEDSIMTMAKIKPDVDFILWTGDNAAHIPTSEFSLKRNLYMIQTTTSAIKRKFPGTLVIPSYGNHDFFPADYTNGTETAFYDTVCRIWSSWIKDPEQMLTCRRGGFYSRLVSPKLRVLAVNTVLYLIENPKSRNLTDPSAQFEWLEETLTAAREAGEKVIVSAHVPPTIPSPSVFHWFYPQYQGRYVELMTRFSDVIVAHHYAHEHSDTFKILQRNDETGASPVFLAPSVTPLRGTKPSGEQFAHRNPGVRLVQYDRQTGRHLGYQQFYTNITEDNNLGKSKWDELYSFTNAYDVPDMSVSSLRKIYHKMAKPFGAFILQYCSFYSVTSTPDDVCTLEEQAAFWCGGQLTDLNKTNECINRYMKQDQNVL